MNINQVNETIQLINQNIDVIKQNIKFKADEKQINLINDNNTEIINKFINEIKSIKELLVEKKKSKQLYPDNSNILSDNENLNVIYSKLIEKIKFDEIKVENKGWILNTNTKKVIKDTNIGLYKLNYNNFNEQIINIYLTYILGELLYLNICFTLFQMTVKNSGNNAASIDNNIINDWLKSILQHKIYLFIKDNNYLEVNLSPTSDNNKITSIDISIGENNQEFKFKINLQYEESFNGKIYDRCNKEGEKDHWDFDIKKLGNEKPSSFKITFEIFNNENKKMSNNISFEIKYYYCKFGVQGTAENNSYRYLFTLNIDGREYFLNRYDDVENYIYKLNIGNKTINKYIN